MADFPKKQQQCLIPKYLLDYTTELNKNHPDPTDPWGGSGGDVNIEAGTGITITTESDDTKVISLDTNPDTFEVTADTGMTLEVENSNPLWTDAKLQMAYTGATRLEGTLIDLYASNGMYFHSDSAPSYVNNTTHEYKTLATTDQLFSGNYNDLTNKPTIPDAVSGTNDGTNWTSLTIGNDTYGLASGGSTYTAGNGIDISNNEISIDTSVVVTRNDLAPVATSGSYEDLADKPDISGMVTTVKYSDVDLYDKIDENWPNVIFIDDEHGTGSYLPVSEDNGTYKFRSADEQTNNDLKSIAVRNLYVYFGGLVDTEITSLSNDYNDLIGTPVIPDTSNMVTTDTTQNITANKIFTDGINVGLTSGGYTAEIRTEKDSLDRARVVLDGFSVRIGDDAYSTYIGNPDAINSISGYQTTVSGVYNTISGSEISFRSSSIPKYKTSSSDTGTNIALVTDIPTVPTNVSAFTNDAGYITGITSSDVTTALGYTPGTSNFSGSYNDLTNKPTIPTVNNKTITIQKNGTTVDSFTLNQSTNKTINISVPTDTNDLTNGAGYITGITSSDVTTALGYTPGTSNFSGDYDDLTDKPDLSIYAQSANLATVATSGSYNDLSNKPTIPTVNDNTITITQGGVTKGSFTLNQNTNQTINVDDVPGMIGEVLYDVPNGEAGVNPITMAHSFADYSYVDIQYRCFDNAYEVRSQRIYDPNGKHVYLDWDVLVSGTVYAKKAIYILSGNTMTVKAGTDMQVWYSNGSTVGTQATATSQYQHQIKITKVVGYKQNSAPILMPSYYVHNLNLKSSDKAFYATAQIINRSSTAFTINTLKQWLYDNNFQTTGTGLYPASGAGKSGSTQIPVVAIRCYDLNSGFNIIAQKGANSFELGVPSEVVDIVIPM